MNHITITDNGQRLLAKITAGETMAVFTRIGISDVQYTDEELQHLQVLEHVRRQADILNVEVKDDTTIVLSCYLNNQESEEGYYVSAVGIYAKAQGEEEILYGITSVENRPFLPGCSETLTGISFRFMLKVGDSRNITISVDETTSLTAGEFHAYRQHFEEELAKMEFPSFEDYTSGSEPLPTTEAAIAGIVAGRSVGSVLQNMKAALLGLQAANLALSGRMERYSPFVTMFQNIPVSERTEDKWYLLAADTKGITIHYCNRYLLMHEDIPLEEREEWVLYGSESERQSSLEHFEKPAVMRMLAFDNLESREILEDLVREQDIFYFYETEER